MNRRVLLIYPPSPSIIRDGYCQSSPDSSICPYAPAKLPPLDLMYLAAAAEKCGAEVKIKDYSLGGDLVKDLNEFRPNFLIANIACATFKKDMEALKIAKELLPQVKIIVFGGIFFTYNTNAVYENPFIDYVIIGEGEEALKAILENIPDSEIPGICYKYNMQGVKAKPKIFNDNLDSLPFPARHLIDNNLYKNDVTGKTRTVIKIARGCPFNCFFCSASLQSGLKVRKRSVDNIIEEIEECIEKYNIHDFIFQSDILGIDKNWLKNLCDKIISEKLNITWSVSSRGDIVTEEDADLMYRAGCRSVDIGVESGSQMILDKIGKRINLDSIIHGIRIYKKSRIKIHTHYIIGLPWDTEQTLNETFKLASWLPSDYTSFYIAAPLPGTRFYDYAIKEKLFSSTTSYEGAYFRPIVRTHSLSKEKVFTLYIQGIKKFYLNLGFIFKSLLNIKHISELKKFFKTELAVLLQKL